MVTIIITSVVAGIHRTKVGSHREIELIVENDDRDNAAGIDPDCMLVRIPPLEAIPPSLHRAVTYPRSRNPRDPSQTDQLACNVAGRKVGNVPSGLCGLFRRLQRSGQVIKI